MTEAFPQALLDTLRRAQRITVPIGAGISAESGLPTVRTTEVPSNGSCEVDGTRSAMRGASQSLSCHTSCASQVRYAVLPAMTGIARMLGRVYECSARMVCSSVS